MKIFIFILSILAGGFHIGEKAARTADASDRMCVTAERIMKPVHSWKILKTEIHYEGKNIFMEVTVHNPLNKMPASIDARFILSIDPGNPTDPQKYNLIAATYYNDKSNVIFKRIYKVHEVVIKKKIQKFPVQTPCFAREVIEIIEIMPDEIKVPNSLPDGGIK